MFSGAQGRQVYAALSACMGAFCLGNVLGFTANVDISKDIPLTDSDKSWIGSLVAVGALVSGPITGFAVERIGRKTTMLVLSAPFVLGWLLITYAGTVAPILIGRIITGFCGGAFSLAAPVYVGEIAEDKIRGTLGAGFQLMVTVGILFVYTVGLALGLDNWEWLALISGFGPLVFLIMMIFPPESPRYLLSKGRQAEASEALRWLRGASSNQEIEEELAQLQRGVDEAKMNKATFKDLRRPEYLKPTLIGMALMFFQQFSGINAVIFYQTDIFTDAGSSLKPAVATVIVGIVQVVATVVASALMDRAGRRLLLILSDVAMGIFLALLGVYFYLKDLNKEDSWGWLPLVSLIIFVVSFSLGFGPVPWLMMGELLPPKALGLASALCTSFNWTLAFIVTKFFASVVDSLTPKWCYWGFAIVCAAGTAFVITFVPETKGKSIDEIRRYFGAEIAESEDSAAAAESGRSKPGNSSTTNN